MATFVLEIGSEEVPSRFLPTEEQELETSQLVGKVLVLQLSTITPVFSGK